MGAVTTGSTVWLASYPKSGNTWFRAVHAAWRTGSAVELNSLDVEGTYGGTAWREQYDAELGIVTSLLTDAELDAVRPSVAAIIDLRAVGPHLRKTHLANTAAPTGERIIGTDATRAALYFVRDPRDVAVSFAHHLGRDLAWTVAHMADPAAFIGPGGRSEEHTSELQSR